MTNVIPFTGSWYGSVNCDDVLTGAYGRLSEVVLFGKDKDGNLYLASSSPNLAELLFLVKKAENYIMSSYD